MKINYTPEGDALSIVLAPTASYDESEEIAKGVVAHYNHDGELIAIEIYAGASHKVDLSRLEAEGLPTTVVATGRARGV